MERKELLLLESHEAIEYNRTYDVMIKFTGLNPETIRKFGFSANAGKFGGFVTDDETTWKKWQEYQEYNDNH